MAPEYEKPKKFDRNLIVIGAGAWIARGSANASRQPRGDRKTVFTGGFRSSDSSERAMYPARKRSCRSP